MDVHIDQTPCEMPAFAALQPTLPRPAKLATNRRTGSAPAPVTGLSVFEFIHTSKPCSPEAFARLSIAKDDNERERVSKLPYLQIIGSLLYLSTMTRPDLRYS